MKEKSKFKHMEIGEEYKCSECQEVFKKTRTHEEVVEEYVENFGVEPEENDCIVCDDCYQRIMNQFHKDC